jgi:hypothetical protein
VALGIDHDEVEHLTLASVDGRLPGELRWQVAREIVEITVRAA